MGLTDKSCREFVEVLASKEPVPGGGGGAALAGALAAALANMVGNLTVGKKKYADVEDELKECMRKMTIIQNDLLDLVEKDAEGFKPLAAAYGLPKSTEEERLYKEKVMEEVLWEACKVPLAIMEKCDEAMEMIKVFADKGSKLMISDAGVAATLCRAAINGAALNIYVNAKSLKDREKAESLNSKADALIEKNSAFGDEIYNSVMNRLK